MWLIVVCARNARRVGGEEGFWRGWLERGTFKVFKRVRTAEISSDLMSASGWQHADILGSSQIDRISGSLLYSPISTLIVLIVSSNMVESILSKP